jgi:sugar phosphate isomerase/epimerase
LFASLDDLEALKGDLQRTGLKMASGHFGLDMVEGSPARVIDIARTLGIGTIFVPHLAADQRPVDANGWGAFGARLNAAGAPLRDAGLTFGWHNHDFEFVKSAETHPIDHILKAGPDLAFEFDVAWCARAGVDPMPVIARYKDRIVAAHVKDIAPAGTCTDEDGWSDVGHGTLDWPGLMTALKTTTCRHFVMEHDNPNDAGRFARRSFDFMNSL